MSRIIDGNRTVYEADVAPLVRKLVKACREHDFPILVAIQTDGRDDSARRVHTTAAIPEDGDLCMLDAYQALRIGAEVPATVQTGAGGKVLAVETHE